MLKTTRQSWIAVAAAALLAGGVGTLSLSHVARADDAMKESAPKADASLKQAAMKCSDDMKQMVADPSKMDAAKVKMAKAMLMDKMSMSLAKEPEFQQMTMAAMQDENMKKTHEAAKAMVEDPAQMKTMMDQIEQDPEAMAIITHNAAMMAMMKEKMGGMGGMMDKMK